MSESPFETEPTWIGRVLTKSLPPDIDPKALYVSYDEDTLRALVLIATSSALFGVAMTLEHRGSHLADVERRAIPLSAISAIATTGSEWIGKDPTDAVGTSSVRVFLTDDLPPFGKVIELPISRDDYQGLRETSREAARRFADILTSLLPK